MFKRARNFILALFLHLVFAITENITGLNIFLKIFKGMRFCSYFFKKNY